MQSQEDFSEEFETDFYAEEGGSPRDRPPDAIINCLKERFGHSAFRPHQWKVISSILDKQQDNCVVMATGYGKSLCYQFPSVYLDTVTLVISPLISLMEDQVLSLTVSNIKACLLGTAQKDKSVLSRVFNFEFNIVYVTPEFITCEIGVQLLKEVKQKLTLIAVDEAHCISKWGHDFRTAFRNLSILRRHAPDTPILAMTATATEQVSKDIVVCLNLRNPQILCTGFDRPNLEFNVRPKGSQGVWSDVSTIINSVLVGSIIIYCITRSDTEQIALTLKSNGVNCAAYHAGLSINQRKTIHEEFVRDKIQVIVATIAFGMGIDKPDVRVVIHYGVSKDIESYYQEVGRAGRDGMSAKCVMFYNRGDFQVHKRLRDNSRNSAEILNNLEKLALKMREFVDTSECRRKFLLQYFEGPSASIPKRKICCDNCRNNLNNQSLTKKYENLDDNGLFDFTKDAILLIKAIDAFNGYTGLIIPLLLLKGSKDRKLAQRYYTHSLYGMGKGKPDDWYKSLADILERNGFLEKHAIQNQFTKINFRNYRIALSQKAKEWLRNPNRQPLKFKPQQDMFRYLTKVKTQFLLDTTNLAKRQNLSLTPQAQKASEIQDIVKDLIKVRASEANKYNVMPYAVATNKALYQIAQTKPLNLDEMKAAQIDGFSEAIIQKFGPQFIKCILERKNFIPPRSESSLEIRNVLKEHPLPNSKMFNTHWATYDLWQMGKSIEEIAQIKGIASSTVSGYMVELIKAGLLCSKIDLRKLGVADFHFKVITERLPSDLQNAKLKDIKNVCEPTITYEMIKFVLAYHQIRDHLKKMNLPFIDPDVSAQKTEKENTAAKKPSTVTSSEDRSDFNISVEDAWGSDSDFDLSQVEEDLDKLEKSTESQNTSLEETKKLSKNDPPKEEQFPDDDLDLFIMEIKKDAGGKTILQKVEEINSKYKDQCANDRASTSIVISDSENDETVSPFFKKNIRPQDQVSIFGDSAKSKTSQEAAISQELKKSNESKSSQESIGKSAKRKFARAVSDFQYADSSSDEEEKKPANKPRPLPNWLPYNSSNSFQSNPKKKSKGIFD